MGSGTLLDYLPIFIMFLIAGGFAVFILFLLPTAYVLLDPIFSLAMKLV